MDLNNKVIEVINKEHGKKVMEFFKSKGIDTKGREGVLTLQDNNDCRYYGVIKGFGFGGYNIATVNCYKAEIIKLPNELPQIGDKILAWDYDESDGVFEEIFIAYIDGIEYPVLCIDCEDKEEFAKNDCSRIYQRKHWKLIPKEEIVELTIQDISDGKGVGIAPHLIRIKK